MSFNVLACVEYKQGHFSQPGNPNEQEKSIPEVNFQSRVFQINPPISVKIGDGQDAESIIARARGEKNLMCAQFESYRWKAFRTKASLDKDKVFPKELLGEIEKTNEEPKQNLAANKGRHQAQTEFSLQKIDLSLFQYNPSPVSVVESLNLFSPEVMPQKITGETSVGLTPSMLLRYAKTVNDDSQLKITNVTSFKKLPGGFYGQHLQSAKDHACNKKIVNALHLGAGISVAISLKFLTADDRIAFQNEFGVEVLSPKPNQELNDASLSAKLKSMKASIEIDIGQIGGSIEETKKTLAQNSCTIDQLDRCRLLRKKVLKQFFYEQLRPPTSLDQTNGWVPVNFETFSIGVNSKH